MDSMGVQVCTFLPTSQLVKQSFNQKITGTVTNRDVLEMPIGDSATRGVLKEGDGIKVLDDYNEDYNKNIPDAAEELHEFPMLLAHPSVTTKESYNNALSPDGIHTFES